MRALGRWNAAAAALAAKRIQGGRSAATAAARKGALVSSNTSHGSDSSSEEHEIGAPSAKVLRVVEDIANLTLSEVADMAVLLKKRLRVPTVPVMPNVVPPELWYNNATGPPATGATIVRSATTVGDDKLSSDEFEDGGDDDDDGDGDELDDAPLKKRSCKKLRKSGALPVVKEELPKGKRAIEGKKAATAEKSTKKATKAPARKKASPPAAAVADDGTPAPTKAAKKAPAPKKAKSEVKK